jgi:YD repeat-containing protein
VRGQFERIGVLAATATYDPASNLTSYTDTNGTINYGYEGANRLVSLAEPGGSCPLAATIPNSTACTVFGYDADNRRTTTGSPNGATSTTVYDNAGRVHSITAQTKAGATLTQRVYVYQSAPLTLADQSLVATMTDQAGTVTTYGYDGLNRLTSAGPTGTASTWVYDNDGNRTQATNPGAATVYSAYNSADQLCWTSTVSTGACASPPSGATTYSYDASGNQSGDQIGATTLANSFNVFNQLTSTLIGGTTTLTSTYAGTSNTERLTAANPSQKGCNSAEETRTGSSAFEGAPLVRRQPASHSGLLTGLDSPLQTGLNDLTATADNFGPFEGGGRQWWWTFGPLRLSSGRGGGVWARNLQEGCHISTNQSQQGWTSGACGNGMAPME